MSLSYYSVSYCRLVRYNFWNKISKKHEKTLSELSIGSSNVCSKKESKFKTSINIQYNSNPVIFDCIERHEIRIIYSAKDYCFFIEIVSVK